MPALRGGACVVSAAAPLPGTRYPPWSPKARLHLCTSNGCGRFVDDGDGCCVACGLLPEDHDPTGDPDDNGISEGISFAQVLDSQLADLLGAEDGT